MATELGTLLDPSLFQGCLPQSCLPQSCLLWPLPAPAPAPPPRPHQPRCICHQPTLLPSPGQALFGGDWQAAHVHGGGSDTHCGRQGFTAIWFPTFPAALCPPWPPAPKGSEPRITRPAPTLPHPHPTHCLLRVSIQRESSPGKNNSQAPTEHREMGLTQGCHKPWHIDPLQS